MKGRYAFSPFLIIAKEGRKQGDTMRGDSCKAA